MGDGEGEGKKGKGAGEGWEWRRSRSRTTRSRVSLRGFVDRGARNRRSLTAQCEEARAAAVCSISGLGLVGSTFKQTSE